MTTTRSLPAAIAVLLVSFQAAAQEGVYIGTALGQASYREACHDFDRLAGTGGAFNCLNREDTAYKVFVGWRFAPYAAVEASYIDFGEAKAQGRVSGATVDASSRVHAAGLSALGILPLGDRVSAYARLGLLQTRTETRSSGAGAASNTQGETEMHVGIGGQVELGRRWGLRAEFERVNDSKIDLASLAVQYRF